MLQKLEAHWLPIFIEPIARVVNRLGISPNMLTFFAFFVMVGAGYVLSLGYLPIGGVLILLSTIFDSLDGTLARISGRASQFGAFLDSTLDRFAEAALYGGLLLYYLREDASLEIVLIYVTVVGSLMVSYSRSRAESIGVPLRQGLMVRALRLLLLVAGLLLNQVLGALWLLAILSNATALQRMWLVWRKIG